MSEKIFLAVSILLWFVVVVLLGITKITNKEKCLSYQGITERKTTYVADTCYVNFNGEFYTRRI